MPTFKISQLTTATAVSATNQLEINQNSASRSLEVSVLDAYVKQGSAIKTYTSVVLNDGYTEEVTSITDGASVVLDPNVASIQVWTLGASRTPTAAAGWNSGQSLTLLVDDGTARTITWTSVGVTWKTDGGSAPTLNTTGFTVIQLWKVASTIYGARVGNN
jgi:hypothetical protein